MEELGGNPSSVLLADALEETAPLRRIPAPMLEERWESFDLLRALAATFVFVHHYCAVLRVQWGSNLLPLWLEWLADKVGSVGTNLLLLICGLFVAKSVARYGFRYRIFLARRLVRIYPPYLLVVFAVLLFAFLFPQFAKLDANHSLGGTFIEQCLLWPGLFPHRPVLTVSWTLSWIMAAYVLLPWPLRMLRRSVRDCYLRAVILGTVAVLFVVYASMGERVSPRVGYIFGGAAVYELLVLVREGRAGRPRLGWPLMVAAGSIALRFSIDSSGSWGTHTHAKMLLFTLCGLLGVSLLTVGAFVLQSRCSLDCSGFLLNSVRRLGRAGYSFYMLHNPIVRVFASAVFPLAAAAGQPSRACLLMLPVCFLLAAAASGGFYLVVERPLQRFASAGLRWPRGFRSVGWIIAVRRSA